MVPQNVAVALLNITFLMHLNFTVLE